MACLPLDADHLYEVLTLCTKESGGDTPRPPPGGHCMAATQLSWLVYVGPNRVGRARLGDTGRIAGTERLSRVDAVDGGRVRLCYVQYSSVYETLV